jgi:hypothetical protein
MLPCARITSIRFKGTFSVAVHFAAHHNTPSECGPEPAREIVCAGVAQPGGGTINREKVQFVSPLRPKPAEIDQKARAAPRRQAATKNRAAKLQLLVV